MNDTSTAPQYRGPRGAEEYAGTNSKFLNIKYGCLCEVSKTKVEGWAEQEIVDRDTGEITVKWIKVYKFVEGWVNKLEWYDREFKGKPYMGWKMHLEANGINYILDLPLNNSATKKVMMSARSIDFNIPLEVRAWTNREDGKLAVWLKQCDVSVPQFYKKGDMKECPEPVEKLGIGGKKKWDWEATDTFLWREMQDHITPLIEECSRNRGVGMGASSTEAPPTSTPSPGAPLYTGPDDDIPF